MPIFILCITISVTVAKNFLTGDTGHRAGTNQNSQTATDDGGILLQDIYALEKLRRFNSERIPERVVHARGAGAWGVFRSAGDFSNLTRAAFLSKPGISTDVFVRFSTVIHGKHSPETLRDPRGFAVKFKTAKEGNWDLVGNNLPVFFIRDHIKFPDLVHSMKPDPITNIQDATRVFDFLSALDGTATHMLTYLYSDLGIPKGYRFMDGNSVHAYKMVTADRKFRYVKFRWISQQGVQNLTVEEAAEVQGRDFNHATRDLYDAIRRGDSPSWELKVQVLPPDRFNTLGFNPLDATKEWPEDEFPFEKLGTMTLNRVPDNFHLTTEQSAFSPGNFLPGAIEPSEDRLLQGRLISYHESQTHRHRSNSFQTLPVNRPLSPVNSYNQDGIMTSSHDWKGSLNYEPNNDPDSFKEDPSNLYSTRRICGRYQQREIRVTANFIQAGQLYRRFDEKDRANLVKNLAIDLKAIRKPTIRDRMCSHFYRADKEYGMRVAKASGCDLRLLKKRAAKLRD